jgi:hypothetical protein
VSGELHTPAAFTPEVRSPVPLDRRLGGPQNRSGCGGEEKKAHYCPSRKLNAGRPFRSLVSVLTELSRPSLVCSP